jgi:hypothetical protein
MDHTKHIGSSALRVQKQIAFSCVGVVHQPTHFSAGNVPNTLEFLVSVSAPSELKKGSDDVDRRPQRFERRHRTNSCRIEAIAIRRF